MTTVEGSRVSEYLELPVVEYTDQQLYDVLSAATEAKARAIGERAIQLTRLVEHYCFEVAERIVKP